MKQDETTAGAPVASPNLKADHTWYNSLFTQLLAPLFAFRYLFEAVEDINPKNFLGKQAPAPEPANAAWRKPSFVGYNSYNFISHGMGAFFGYIVAQYSANTLHDIKSMYAEAVGYELNKKTEDVSLGDIFFKSKNAALDITRDAYTKRTLARAATVGTFFVPWHKLRFFKDVKPKYDANAKVGVGAIGAYLYGEGFLREPSFFDVEQKLVSAKVKHKDTDPYGDINAQDVQRLLTLQREHVHPDYHTPTGASDQAQKDIALASRIAELLNQTYGNAPSHEYANFTIGKFNYLIGFGLLDNHPASLGFVEMANKSADMEDVKTAAAALERGDTPETVFAKAGISLTPQSSVAEVESAPLAKFAERATLPTKLGQDKPRSHVEFAQHHPPLTAGIA